jgi:hypothetical protein
MPYTFEQASEIIEDFEDLIGTEIVMGNRDTEIYYITQASFGLNSYVDYARQHHELVTSNPAHIYENATNEYEVIVIIGQPGSFTAKPIKEYVSEAGIGYNFPV